jgi:hypothetical protein
MFSERLSRNLRFIAVDGSEEYSHIPALIWLHQSHISAKFASRQCAAMTARRFPPPERAESFWVQDAGQTVGSFYFRADPLVARTAGVLLKDEARRMAVNFARLPELLGKRDGG